jgi:hypothetical protein
VDKKDCIVPICPAHSEPEKTPAVKEPTPVKPAKPVKTRKVVLDADGNPKVRKPRKTKKASPSGAADKPAKTKVQKPRKTKKTVTLNVIATKLELDETGDTDETLKTTISNEAEVLPELVPILHLNKVEPTVDTAQKPKNITIKRKRVKQAVGQAVGPGVVEKDKTENDIKLKGKEDNMEARINNAKQLVARFRGQGIDMLDTLNESQLVEWLEAAGDAYYNTKTAIMSDNEYDIIKEYMEVKYPTNEVLTNIGANVTKNNCFLF